jgi:hypothetical protein
MDPDPSIFIIDLQDGNKKRNSFNKFFGLVLFEGTLHHFSKIKSKKISHKTVEINVFLTIFA